MNKVLYSCLSSHKCRVGNVSNPRRLETDKRCVFWDQAFVSVLLSFLVRDSKPALNGCCVKNLTGQFFTITGDF